MTDKADIAHDETERLIASDKVEGTAVYDRDGDKLGTIKNFMVEKRSGQVEYAVLSTGGLFGSGDRHLPIPWDELRYDTDQNGYVVERGRSKLEGAPSHEAGEEPRYDRDYDRKIREHYR